MKQGEVSGKHQEIFEPVVEMTAANHILIDTSLPIDEAIHRILERID